jgi:hypothetical protein
MIPGLLSCRKGGGDQEAGFVDDRNFLACSEAGSDGACQIRALALSPVFVYYGSALIAEGITAGSPDWGLSTAPLDVGSQVMARLRCRLARGQSREPPRGVRSVFGRHLDIRRAPASS